MLRSALHAKCRFALFVAAVAISSSALAAHVGWGFIEDVGGMTVESPTLELSGWLFPVRVDLSGATAVTREAGKLNSFLVCERTQAVTEGRNIYLSVIAGPPAGRGLSARCPPANLGVLAPGIYRVFYRGPNELPVYLDDVTVGSSPLTTPVEPRTP